MDGDLADRFAVKFLSSGTDGQDGPTDAAGAIVDPDTIRRAKKAGMDTEAFLNDNDAYNFFDRLDNGRNLVKTGLTGTNVMDIHVILVSQCHR